MSRESMHGYYRRKKHERDEGLSELQRARDEARKQGNKSLARKLDRAADRARDRVKGKLLDDPLFDISEDGWIY